MRVAVLADELLAAACQQSPLDASLQGLAGFDALLPDLSVDGEERLAGRFERIAEAARALSTAPEAERLGEVDRQTVELVAHAASVSAASLRLGAVEWTVTNRFVAPAGELVVSLPQLALGDEARRQAYRMRLAQGPDYLERAAERHRRGAGSGRLPVRRLVYSAVAQLEGVLADPSLAGIGRAGAEEMAAGVVAPALAAYRDELERLLEAARDDDHPGLVHLPGGEEAYATCVRRHTGFERAPAELHELGIELTERLVEEYAEVGRRALGTGERGAVFERLRSDRALRYASAEEMLAEAVAAVRRAEAAAPEWFLTVAPTPCAVEPVPSADEAGSSPAYYLPPAVDGSRLGTYFLNTSRPTERSRHTAEATAFHEAVPGHHFQLSIAQRAEGLPLARRVLHDTAAAEGWGLYAERLADEMGLYSDDVSRLGMLSTDSWRAGRLVVDTGLHAFGWSRAKAVQWLRDNTPIAETTIESEVDRYIAGPGQALSYMVGRIELQRLRSTAQARLGKDFDLRWFHDLVLQAGPLPLPVLAASVSRVLDAAEAAPTGDPRT